MGLPGPTIVLVHGAWHDQRCWVDVTAELDIRGATWATLTLPSTDPGDALPGFAADIGAVIDLLDGLDGDVTLCGHSYGGMVVSEAGNHGRVTRLVYLAAACPQPGERLLDPALGSRRRFRSAIRRTADGRIIVAPQRAARLLYGDLRPEVAASKAMMLLPSTASIVRARATNPAWLNKPATYVVCQRDRVISVRKARKTANLVVRSQIAIGRTVNPAVTLDTSHCPFFSAPELVAEILVDHR
jgi:pimeloyl-ACP methyl ester carboxylesterase